MNKQELLNELRQAKTAHIRWRTYAQSIVNAPGQLDKIEEKAPVHHTDCKFGCWYYTHQDKLMDIPGFAEIEPLHETLHQIYAQLFELMSTKDKSGTLSRLLLGGAKRYKEKQQNSATALLEELGKISREMLDTLETVEQEIARQD